MVYPCDEDLVCHDGKCTDYADLLDVDTKGTCKQGSPEGTIKVMTYNLFLINCIFPKFVGNPMPCQHEDEQKTRIEKLGPWFDQIDADVVSRMSTSFLNTMANYLLLTLVCFAIRLGDVPRSVESQRRNHHCHDKCRILPLCFQRL